MENYTQDNRLLRVETPLGKDALLLQSFEGKEAISDLFEFDLTMHSADHDIALDSLIGEAANIVIRTDDKSERFINGVISEFRHTGTFLLEDGVESSLLSHYQMKLVPWFWTLTLNRDCRIFQNKNVPDIVREIFSEHRAAEFEMRLNADYAPREFCVQYRESDFNFVSRLLEEEGIFYFFEHSPKKHKLVLADDPTQFNPLPNQSKIDFAVVADTAETEAIISDWQVSRRMRSERFELRDYNFRNPALDLTTNLESPKSRGREFEIYDYPGEYELRNTGDKLVRTRFEAEKAQELIIFAESVGRGFQPGYRFELKRHPRKDFNREYTLLQVEHRASQAGNYRSGSAGEAFSYNCKFVCFPHPTKFRPVRKTPIPKIQGTQTAVVVGKKGEEIEVDKHGRVKVHFHWDRVAKNAKSSCWIRVSQPWAGTGFGGITIPRIGQEVIVDFLEGDPDRPIITGRVYNGALKPPYDLPANKAHSGLMSRSTPKGGSQNFNGIRFNDEIGGEKFAVQAEKNQEILVKNDKAEDVWNDETVNIGNNRTEQVFGNEVRTISKDLMRSVMQNQAEFVGMNRGTDVVLNDNLNIGGSQQVTVGVIADVIAYREFDIDTPGSQFIEIAQDQMASIGNRQVISIGHTIVEAINKLHKADPQSQYVIVKKTQSTSVGGEYLLNVGENQVKISAISDGKLLIESTESIEIKCGASSIKMDKIGNIDIKGTYIKIDGTKRIDIG